LKLLIDQVCVHLPYTDNEVINEKRQVYWEQNLYCYLIDVLEDARKQGNSNDSPDNYLLCTFQFIAYCKSI